LLARSLVGVDPAPLLPSIITRVGRGCGP
jgi:hypothetical protein